MPTRAKRVATVVAFIVLLCNVFGVEFMSCAMWFKSI